MDTATLNLPPSTLLVFFHVRDCWSHVQMVSIFSKAEDTALGDNSCSRIHYHGTTGCVA
jgi:hypothetical protein